MARGAKKTWAGLLLLGVAVVTLSALAAAGVLFTGGHSQVATPQVTPVPAVFGMTTAKAVRTLKAAHLRPVVQFSPHAKGQATGIVVAMVPGAHPISVGGGHSVGVASEGDAIPVIVSR